ncbi:MAG: DUF167 domain-containing protein [Bacteroidia bacterium]|nr:DUF167 domain-containing protein [Bacteroidia bacterium]
MRLTVHAKPGARKNEVEYLEDGSVRVWLRSGPVDGKANKELIEYLSQILGTPKRNVRIHTGSAGRYKLMDIDLEEKEVKEILEAYRVPKP